MNLHELIAANEVVTSSQLQQRMTARGQTAVQARKQLSRYVRNERGLWRSESLVLPRNERLFAQESFVGNLRFFEAIASCLKTSRPGLARCLQAAATRSLLLEYEVARLCGSLLSPSAKAKTPTLLEDIDALQEAGLRYEIDGIGTSRLVQQASNTVHNRGPGIAAAAKRTIETRIAKVFGEYLTQQNIIGWTSLSIADSRNGIVDYNGYACTGKAHSWLSPLKIRRRGTKDRPTPVLLDVYARMCQIEDVEGFVHRLEKAQYARSLNSRFLGFIVAPEFTNSAYDAAKAAGLATINSREFLGQAALTAINAVESLLARAGESPDRLGESIPNHLVDSLESLRSHPLIASIKSKAFEATVALILRTKGWEDVRLGVSVPFKTSSRDIDVVGQRDGGAQIVAIECKAHRNNKEPARDDIKKFFCESVPSFMKYRASGNGNPSIKTVQAEFWTTGTIGSDARELLNELKFSRNVEAKLVGLNELLPQVSPTLKRANELLNEIAKL